MYQHVIETDDAPPVRKRFYRQTPQVFEEMNRQIEQMLKYDIIEESNNEWQSPVVMCKKKSGEMRFCVDYRLLIKYTRQNFFPLPRLEDVFDALGKAQVSIFSTLDLLSGYWQCGLNPKTAHKAAFVTPSGVYQWERLPFGLASAPSSFQHLLTQDPRSLNYKIALVYVDDILVFSRSFEEHVNHLQLVFDKLISAGLTLKPGKCLFARKEVIYLGHTISKEGVKVDTSKVDAVSSFSVPKNQKQIRSFLGLTNYYRKFIEGYSHITTPLNHLMGNDVPFEWSEKCQMAFDQLKKALCSAPILAYPNMSKPFILTTDASGTAIGYILGQLDSKGQEKVIAYGGRSLTQGERAWGGQ
ncbi:Transposon Ty3-G Gag-Pol polyprotein [Mytilus coruscus]|uniref:Transposon Ty3-G Gag-Pol polyprotein n=1 Tax=Mytilus coruscus TaxID=42192 RepID=A0A6J8BGG2_MYTCO|nr:Transposon Ty3-G Gag-Pol polyprotein [Mytilus coruscus]